jgi:glycosyltransferase involved in cell wall biosynthesis
VIHQENRGISEARNRGLSEAEGNYIAPVDSDDYVHPRYFESMMHCMKEKKASLVICDFRTFQDGEDPLPAASPKISYRRLDCSEFYGTVHARNMTWGRIYRREDIGNLRYAPEVHIAEDTLFTLFAVRNMDSPEIYDGFSSAFLREKDVFHNAQRQLSILCRNWKMVS